MKFNEYIVEATIGAKNYKSISSSLFKRDTGGVVIKAYNYYIVAGDSSNTCIIQIITDGSNEEDPFTFIYYGQIKSSFDGKEIEVNGKTIKLSPWKKIDKDIFDYIQKNIPLVNKRIKW